MIQELYNVKQFGAKGDGATDDSAAIQAAIDTAFAAGGGTVYLPESTYIISAATLKLKTNVGLAGDGPAASILKLGDGANRHVLATLTDVDTYIGTGNTSVGEYGIHLRDFSIDGNKANNSAGRGLSCYWFKCELRNVIISNCKARGIYEGWGSFGTPAPFEDMTNTYNSVTVTSCDGVDQWYHDGPHDSKFHGCIVCQGIGTSNIHVGPDGAGAMFVNCHSWSELGVRQPNWSVIFEGPFCMWSNSTAEGGSVGQLLLRANDAIISGGAQYCINSAYNQIGIQIGDSANGFTAISGYDIRTITRNFSVATIAFNSDGGLGRIEINGFNTVASTLYTGSPAVTSFIEILVTGFGGTLIQIPSAAVLGLGGLVQSVGGALHFLNLHGDANKFPAALVQFVASALGPHLSFAKSRAAAAGSHATVQNGDTLGNTVFTGDDGTTLDSIAAGFGVIVDGTPATGKIPGTFVWSTTPQGATSALERMRLDSKGNLVVGPSVLATNAADGFVYIPTCAGTPTGTPTAYNGSPVVIDTTNNRLYFYSSGAWRNAGP